MLTLIGIVSTFLDELEPSTGSKTDIVSGEKAWADLTCPVSGDVSPAGVDNRPSGKAVSGDPGSMAAGNCNLVAEEEREQDDGDLDPGCEPGDRLSFLLDPRCLPRPPAMICLQ